jgi:transposase
MGEYSGPYKSQHPLKPPELIDAQSAVIYSKWLNGVPFRTICEDVGVPRSTAYQYLNKLITGLAGPSWNARRLREEEHLEQLTELLMERISDVTVKELVPLVGEARKLSEARINLVRVRDGDTTIVPVEDDEPPHDWETEQT